MQNKVVINATLYTGNEEREKIDSGYIRFNEKVLEIGEMAEYKEQSGEEVIDAAGKVIIPGMIDIHIHGGYGVDVMDADPEKLLFLSEKLLEEGVTSFFATTITQKHEEITEALRAVKEAKERGASIEGVHLEGPFVNEKKAGAQPVQYIVPPDIDQFLEWHEASGEQIKLVTYAPEKPGAREFENMLIERGIVPSMGHTDATREQLLESRTSHATHLFNAMNGLHHREAGGAGHALLTDGLYAEIICDGIHVVADMVNLSYKVKGAKGISIISDAMRAKGMPEGESELGGQKVTIKDGQARLENGSLAGSVLKMDDAFRNVIEFTGCPVEEAVRMTSGNQAREFGLEQKGELAPGKDADFVIMSPELVVEKTYRLGAGN